MSDEKLYDVVIFEIATRRISAVTGTNLGNSGFHTVDKRLETTLGRLNDLYDAEAVPAGVYKKDDILPEEC